jgi:septal ring factor EnvC (AmiA/AmiB activator)
LIQLNKTSKKNFSTTYRVSNGKIKIDSSAYCKKSEKKLKKEQKIRDEKEQQSQKELKEIKRKQQELAKQIRTLNKQFVEKKTELSNIRYENKKSETLLDEIQQYLENQNK